MFQFMVSGLWWTILVLVPLRATSFKKDQLLKGGAVNSGDIRVGAMKGGVMKSGTMEFGAIAGGAM
jgi:hypothetical protein